MIQCRERLAVHAHIPGFVGIAFFFKRQIHLVHQLIQADAECVNIRLRGKLIRRLRIDDLRRGIRIGILHRASGAGACRDTEAAELCGAGAGEENFVRLNIPVHDALRVRIGQRLCKIHCKRADADLGKVKAVRTDPVSQAVKLLHPDQIRITLKLAVSLELFQCFVLIGDDVGALLHLEQQVGFALGALLCLGDLRLLLLVVEVCARRGERNDFEHRRFRPVHASGFQAVREAVRRRGQLLLAFPASPEGLRELFRDLFERFHADHMPHPSFSFQFECGKPRGLPCMLCALYTILVYNILNCLSIPFRHKVIKKADIA